MRKIAFAFFVLFLSSCSHLAYQPAREQFYDPKQLDLKYEDVSFTTRDGVKLHGWYFPADTSNTHGKVQGTLIQFHGNAQNISTHFYSLAWTTKAGYNFFTFDYRGYGASDGDPSQEGLNQDALAAYDYVRQRSPRKNGSTRDIVLYGQSLGGAVLVRAYSEMEEKDRVRTVVVDSSFYSYKKIAQNMLSRSWLTWIFQPLGYLLVSDEYSPENYFAKISPTPLLVIHGDRDGTIPSQFGRKIYELAAEPKQLWIVPGGTHIDSMARKDGTYREKLVQYLQTLPGAPLIADQRPKIAKKQVK